MGHPSYVQSLAFSNDGTTLAAGSAERTVWLWAAATGELRQVGGEGWVMPGGPTPYGEGGGGFIFGGGGVLAMGEGEGGPCGVMLPQA